MHIIPAEPTPNNYPIYLGTDIFAQINAVCTGRSLLVVDANIMPLFTQKIKEVFIDPIDIVVLDPSEQNKDWRSVEKILYSLITNHHDRSSNIISLGGGMINDLTGFAAAIYMRGISWFTMPTTLLAQVDAAIGGKTACNFAGLKNQIGCFYQPKAVIIDCASLATLPQREYIAGLSEVIKYGVIRDAKFFAWLERNVAQILQRDQAVLQTMILHCCEMKRKVVAQDATDQDLRMILNFGHSFAHAIESATKFNCLLHGEAVALGMLLATSLAVRLEIAEIGVYDRLLTLLTRFGLPVEVADLPCSISTICDFLAHDKKAHKKQPTLVLPLTLGEVRVVKDLDLKLIEELLADYVSA